MSARSPSAVPMSPQRLRRRGPGTLDIDPTQMSPISSSTTPRSTLGSPLTSHAVKRSVSGGGDAAAGKRRSISLSDVEVLPWLCCMAPAIISFGLFGLVTVSTFFMPTVSVWLLAYLTGFSIIWIVLNTILCVIGCLRMRWATRQDWHSMLEEVQQVDPDGSSFLHIVIIPNYKENENMMQETLDMLGRSPLAATRMRVVLGMETREGAVAHEKANRLIQQKGHLFADIIASFHPDGMPDEVAGKSSNTQWAYREALRHFGPSLLGYDLSTVFVTVMDADTLFHPQYFSALTYSALMMSEEERAWRIWQSPAVLTRNILSVPGPTRLASHATLVFELSGLVCPKWFLPHMAFSAYSLTLALCSHPEVNGWDADVIAEDHHMTLKCFFANLWELARASKESTSKKSGNQPPEEPLEIQSHLVVEPIYLPVVSFLVESRDGYFASVYARYLQARRHLQGVVELGYVLLQYARLCGYTGFREIPKQTHMAIWAFVIKMYILEIQTNIQCWALCLAIATNVVPKAVLWILSGGIFTVITGPLEFSMGTVWQALDATQQVVLCVVGQISFFSLLYAYVNYMAFGDCLQGYHYQCLPPLSRPSMFPVAECDDDNAVGSEVGDSPTRPQETQNQTEDSPDPGVPSFVLGPFTVWQRVKFYVHILYETISLGWPVMLLYGLVPLMMACLSLFQRGTKFEYIVAEKPE